MPSEVFMSIIIINFNDRFKRCFRLNGFISTWKNKILQQGYSMRITESPILDSLDHSAHKISGWHKFKMSEKIFRSYFMVLICTEYRYLSISTTQIYHYRWKQ